MWKNLALALSLLLAAQANAAITPQAEKQREQSTSVHNHHNPRDMNGANEKDEIDKKPIPELEILSQEGKRIRFYDDLLKGKVVVISFIYTTCANVCPMQGENLSRLQELLGDRLGKDINLISISTDPVTDTPERLKTWSKMFSAKPGWTLVTGRKADIDKLMTALVGYIVDKGTHDPIVLLGNQDKGRWVTAFGLASPERLVKMLDEMSDKTSEH